MCGKRSPASLPHVDAWDHCGHPVVAWRERKAGDTPLGERKESDLRPVRPPRRKRATGPNRGVRLPLPPSPRRPPHRPRTVSGSAPRRGTDSACQTPSVAACSQATCIPSYRPAKPNPCKKTITNQGSFPQSQRNPRAVPSRRTWPYGPRPPSALRPTRKAGRQREPLLGQRPYYGRGPGSAIRPRASVPGA